MVCYTIAVVPVKGILTKRDQVDLNALGIIGHYTVIVFTWVKILNQVIPNAPFPNNDAAVIAYRHYFNQLIGPQFITQRCRISAVGDGLVLGVRFPNNGQDVSVGQHDGVVMLALAGTGKGIVPQYITVPIEQFDNTPVAAYSKLAVAHSAGA